MILLKKQQKNRIEITCYETRIFYSSWRRQAKTKCIECLMQRPKLALMRAVELQEQ